MEQMGKCQRISFKLADFGVAKLLNRDAQEAYYGAEYEGAPTYMAPEVYDDHESGKTCVLYCRRCYIIW